jgi:membrane-associated phospholipid phosphatase
LKFRVALAFSVAALCIGALAAIYAVAFATDTGRRADARIFNRIGRGDDSQLRKLGRHIGGDRLNVMAAAGVVVAAVALAVFSLMEKTRLRGPLVLALVAGSFLTTQLIKPPLGDWGRHLAPDRVATDAFPSGHATLSMAIVLAAVMATPIRHRRRTTVVAAALATLFGLLIVIAGLHPPSDVVGGFLVAGAWAALLTPFVRPLEQSSATQAEHRHPHLEHIGMGTFALVGFLFAGGVAIYVEQVFGVHRALLFLITGLVLTSTLLVAAIGTLSDLSERRP